MLYVMYIVGLIFLLMSHLAYFVSEFLVPAVHFSASIVSSS